MPPVTRAASFPRDWKYWTCLCCRIVIVGANEAAHDQHCDADPRATGPDEGRI